VKFVDVMKPNDMYEENEDEKTAEKCHGCWCRRS
jgi:hypothetical protein